ncbi:hypothetical protein [Hymenobacter norwichensis]|uniref:hypothetical protein n=1 Tax=Hymenobacter norwichensis TaxID=223903 RepID=UPI0003B5953F|nr:hypothetical protein [Hymenobacter norwichensis]
MNRPIALFFSAVCHPLLVPSYLYYVVCYQLPGVLPHLPLPDRWHLLSVVVLFTFILPTLGTLLLLWAGWLKGTLELRERPQRPLPLLLTTVSFGAATVLFSTTPEMLDPLLRYMMAGMTLTVLLTLLVSLRWKISAHGAGVGGAVGLFTVLFFSEPAIGPVLWWLLGSLAVAGAVLKARLALQAHTPAQAWAGFALGVGLVIGFGAGLALK